MPCYDYECPRCQHATELIHSIKDCDASWLCPVCQAAMARVIASAVAVKPPPDMFWENENGGKGREFTQFCGNKYRPGDPRNKRYFRSQHEAIETAKREGYRVERAR